MGKELRDRGAAAVEFALVLPVLVLLTFGIIAFGHAFHIQTVLDNAARDAVRIVALRDGPTFAADARAIARVSVTPSIASSDPNLQIVVPATCPAGQNARVSVTLRNYQLLSGFFGTINLTGTGTMRCNG